VEAVRPPRDPSRNALFQVNFRVQGGSPAALELRDVTTEFLRPAGNGFSKFDLAVESPSSPKSMGFFEYSTDLFDASTREDVRQLLCLVAYIARRSTVPPCRHAAGARDLPELPPSCSCQPNFRGLTSRSAVG
jgi:hypothetical protein